MSVYFLGKPYGIFYGIFYGKIREIIYGIIYGIFSEIIPEINPGKKTERKGVPGFGFLPPPAAAGAG